jgi:(4S)-4-hydroxy-5-phosphonooxypentane-2,3-dione isomerase
MRPEMPVDAAAALWATQSRIARSATGNVLFDLRAAKSARMAVGMHIRGESMVVTTVKVAVKPENISEFIQATIKNHEASTKEPGNTRFDVLQSTEDPAMFLLYEAYESDAAAAAHKKTSHYLQWRETVAPWMAQPREGKPYKSIRP